jgi:hypothetical protein
MNFGVEKSWKYEGRKFLALTKENVLCDRIKTSVTKI